MKVLIWLLIVGAVVFLWRKILSFFKFPKISAIAIFTGAVKVGKSGVSFACAWQKYRSVHFWWFVRSFFRKIFKKQAIEEPLFYSNVPLAGVKYHDLEIDHILRKKRFAFGSVVFIDEGSLLADCYLSKIKGNVDCDLSIELLKFVKLFGHETRGGYLILNSQSMSDLSIAIRKCTNQVFYIHSTHSVRLLPISFCKIREERYSEDGNTVNSYNEDVEESLKTVLFRKKVFKMYDRFSFSSLTDNLPFDFVSHYNRVGRCPKADHITSFRKEFAELYTDLKKNKELKK